MSYNSLLVQKCDHYRKTVDKTESHGYTAEATWTLINENVRCRGQNLFESSSGIKLQTAGISSENDYLFFFNKSYDIRRGDKIIWNGDTLFVKPVQQIYDRKTMHHKEVYCGLSET